jgi:hypothetical protein
LIIQYSGTTSFAPQTLALASKGRSSTLTTEALSAPATRLPHDGHDREIGGSPFD